MANVIKTTFETEQREKDQAFLRLTPLERWEQAYQVRLRMRRHDLDYSFKGKTVTIKRP